MVLPRPTGQDTAATVQIVPNASSCEVAERYKSIFTAFASGAKITAL
jgi:hypothetical protein